VHLFDFAWLTEVEYDQRLITSNLPLWTLQKWDNKL